MTDTFELDLGLPIIPAEVAKVAEPPYSSSLEDVHTWGIMTRERVIFLESTAYSEEGGDLGIGHATAQRFLKNLAILESLSSDPIVIILNSIGGCVSNGFAMYDAITQCQSPTIIKVYGNCMSMGTVLLQAGDSRILSEHCSVMMHHGVGEFAGGANMFEVVNAAQFGMEIGDKADRICLKAINTHRVTSGLSEMGYEEFQAMNLRGRYMHPEEAVALGLADYIFDKDTESSIIDNSLPEDISPSI